jgi:hypothetical protein
MEAPVQHAPSRRPIRVTVLVVIALLIGPAVVLANHQFNDVATGASYHDEVEDLVGAGITAGCGGGNYCPGQAVNRGQMAQFMVRGLGLATAGYGEVLASETETFYVATVAIHTGGLPGGTGYVTVDADLNVLDLSGTCPCGVIFSIEETTTFEPGPVGTMGTSPVVSGGSAASGSVSWVFEVPTGADVEYGLWASIFADEPVLTGPGTTGVAEPVLTGSLTAEYSPFGAAGELPVKVPFGADIQDWSGRDMIEGGRRVQGR